MAALSELSNVRERHSEEVDLRHVRQRKVCDCVIATAAVIANVSYDRAAAFSPVVPGLRGLRLTESKNFFETVTGISWNSPKLHWFTRLSSVVSANASFVAVVRPTLLTLNYHCVYVQDRMVFDPELSRPFPIDRYTMRDWWIGFSMTAKAPLRLLAIQKFHSDAIGM